jgi:hypothetical protein
VIAYDPAIDIIGISGKILHFTSGSRVMANEQRGNSSGLPMALVIIGLALVTIGTINTGPLQIVLMLAAIGMITYGIVLMRKNKKSPSKGA